MYRNWSTRYPVKHPEWKIFDMDVNWKSSEDIRDQQGQKIEGVNLLNNF